MYIASNEARAEALAAARIEVDPAADVGAAGGRVMGIRSFDPVTQLITATLDYIVVCRRRNRRSAMPRCRCSSI